MREGRIIKLLVLLFWTFFWGLSVLDKIIPDVHTFWVGKDFFALFIKFFSSLGLKNPLVATVALAAVSALEVLNFVFYLVAFKNFFSKKEAQTKTWFFRAVLSSMLLFSLFTIADQVFGDRFQLLEHALFYVVLLASWLLFAYFSEEHKEDTITISKSPLRVAVLVGLLLTALTSFSIFNFSSVTFANNDRAVEGQEVVDGIYKFDFPFLADKLVWEKTINAFKQSHPELEVTYIYTGPSELNSKKKTHMLLYVFTKEKAKAIK